MCWFVTGGHPVMCSGPFQAVFTVLSRLLTVPLAESSCLSSTSSHGKKMNAEKDDFFGGETAVPLPPELLAPDGTKLKLLIPHFSVFLSFF